MDYSAYLVPLLLAFTALFGLWKRVNVYDALSLGAREGLDILLGILPNLVGLMTAVYMLRASGLMDALGGLMAPVLVRLGIPPETAALLFIRPVSGSGALAVGSELMASHGPDSYVGRVAAVMLGSTETTFYTIAVYFGSAGIRKTRYAIPAALIADLAGFMAAALAGRPAFGAGGRGLGYNPENQKGGPPASWVRRSLFARFRFRPEGRGRGFLRLHRQTGTAQKGNRQNR